MDYDTSNEMRSAIESQDRDMRADEAESIKGREDVELKEKIEYAEQNPRQVLQEMGLVDDFTEDIANEDVYDHSHSLDEE